MLLTYLLYFIRFYLLASLPAYLPARVLKLSTYLFTLYKTDLYLLPK